MQFISFIASHFVNLIYELSNLAHILEIWKEISS